MVVCVVDMAVKLRLRAGNAMHNRLRMCTIVLGHRLCGQRLVAKSQYETLRLHLHCSGMFAVFPPHGNLMYSLPFELRIKYRRPGINFNENFLQKVAVAE